jgi:acetyl-CoA carboxylase carboxyltransferase component
VVGTGYVAGRAVAAGTLGKMHASKMVRVMQTAAHASMPIVAFNDSGGARIQEGVDALSGYGQVFYMNVLLSGVVPQIAVICGPCAGGAAYSPALMDFVIMTKAHVRMFITGPEVIKAVTGRTVTMDEVGGASMHARVSGNVHFLADDDRHAVQRLLGFLPANNSEDPPHRLNADIDEAPDEAMTALIPEKSSTPLDARPVIARLVDGGDFPRGARLDLPRTSSLVLRASTAWWSV